MTVIADGPERLLCGADRPQLPFVHPAGTTFRIPAVEGLTRTAVYRADLRIAAHEHPIPQWPDQERESRSRLPPAGIVEVVPASENATTVSAVNFYRLEYGKIVEVKEQPDLQALMTQIGALHPVAGQLLGRHLAVKRCWPCVWNALTVI